MTKKKQQHVFAVLRGSLWFTLYERLPGIYTIYTTIRVLKWTTAAVTATRTILLLLNKTLFNTGHRRVSTAEREVLNQLF